MDPYLEGSAWESFHAALIDEIGRQLAPKLRPKYMVRVERRIVVDITDAPADVAVAARGFSPVVRGEAVAFEPPRMPATETSARAPQRSVSILDVAQRKLVTAIELLSPTNKRPGGGREVYLERRESFLAGEAHLIEIDLLRRGTPLPMRGVLPPASYYAFVSRAGHRPMTGVWPISLRGPVPPIPVPLLAGDPDAPLELQAALAAVYDAFGFDLELDYRRPPQFPLPPEEAAWVREHLGSPARFPRRGSESRALETGKSAAFGNWLSPRGQPRHRQEAPGSLRLRPPANLAEFRRISH